MDVNIILDSRVQTHLETSDIASHNAFNPAESSSFQPYPTPSVDDYDSNLESVFRKSNRLSLQNSSLYPANIDKTLTSRSPNVCNVENNNVDKLRPKQLNRKDFENLFIDSKTRPGLSAKRLLRHKTQCSTRNLSLISLVFGLAATGSLSLAASTDFWLHTTESLAKHHNFTAETTDNDYYYDDDTTDATTTEALDVVQIQTHSGLWRICIVYNQGSFERVYLTFQSIVK